MEQGVGLGIYGFGFWVVFRVQRLGFKSLGLLA